MEGQGANRAHDHKDSHRQRTSIVLDARSIKVQLYRTILVNQRVSFHDQYGSGRLGKQALTALLQEWESSRDHLDTVEESNEPVEKPALLWSRLGKTLTVHRRLEQLQNSGLPWVGKRAKYAIYNRLTVGIDVAKGFSEASGYALSELNETGHLAAMGSGHVLQEVKLEVQEQFEESASVLKDMRNIFPEVFQSIASKHSARILLEKERVSIQSLYTHGILDDVTREKLTKEAENRMRKLNIMDPWVPLATKEQMLMEIPWVVGLSTECMELIVRHSVQVIFKKGEYIMRKEAGMDGRKNSILDKMMMEAKARGQALAKGDGGKGDGKGDGKGGAEGGGGSDHGGEGGGGGENDGANNIFMISRGLVNVSALVDGEKKVVAGNEGVGFTIGAEAILRGTARQTDAVAVSTVVAFEFPYQALMQTIAEHPEMEISLWKHIAATTAPGILYAVEKYKRFSHEQMQEFIRKWTLAKAESGVQNSRRASFGGFGVTEKCARQILLLHGVAFAYGQGDRDAHQGAFDEEGEQLHVYDPRRAFRRWETVL
jgi:CRP-like cAMP-binding protein